MLKISTPGALTSTSAPQFDALHLASLTVVAATVTTSSPSKSKYEGAF